MQDSSELSITLSKHEIRHKIFTIRNSQVMIDNDLAALFNVSVKRMNEQVKRNINRFPKSFRFQLTNKEKKRTGRKLRPAR